MHTTLRQKLYIICRDGHSFASLHCFEENKPMKINAIDREPSLTGKISCVVRD